MKAPPAPLKPVGAVATGLLLFAAFPPLEQSVLAWVALVPLLAAARQAGAREGFRLGFLAGCAFWLASLFWLTRVTWPGWLGLGLYCALYLGAFGAFAGAWLRRFGLDRLGPNLVFMSAAAAVWVSLEWLRGWLLTGFPWNGLGVALYRDTALIQWAAWGGVPAVSALLVFANAALAATLAPMLQHGLGRARRIHAELLAALALLFAALSGGWRTLSNPPETGESVRAVLVQTAIPQDEKWDPEKIAVIYRRLHELTSAAVIMRPDLVVWPETALPDDLRGSEPSYELVYRLATNGVPILVGSMDTDWPDQGEEQYFNCSFLVDGRGVIVEEYRKRHLVIFGEYVPFRHTLPFLKAMTPIQASFDAGTTSTVFRAATPAAPFSVLICFEDTIAGLARASVRNGARWLINQTNDAWFDPLWGSRQHVAHCVFRCVENRVPAVRCANTGVSGHIDALGRIVDSLRGEDGGTIFPGFLTAEVRPAPTDQPATFYTRHGDLFAGCCAAFAAFAAGFLALAARRRDAVP